MSVKMIVLSNGDKVIGNMVDIETGKLKIKEAFILKEVMTEEGFSIIPLPFVQTSDSEIIINLANITVYPCNPKKELLDMYTQITSNILIPKSNIRLN
jgi:hypothetical protein